MHKLRVADIESLMFVHEQCLCYKEFPITGDSIGEDVILRMLETFVKKLDAVIAGCDLEPCRWFRQGCDSKPWQWLEKR